MCFPFMGESIQPPNEKAKSFVTYLKYLLFCQLIIGIFKLFVGFWDTSNSTGYGAITELISCCFIYCAYAQLNYCSCIIYIFFCLFAAIEDFVIVGRELQNSNPLFGHQYTSARNLSMGITIVSFFYYIIAIYITFLAYREFKAVTLEMGGMLQPRGNDNDEADDGYGAGYGGYGFGGQQQPAPQQQYAGNYLIYIIFFRGGGGVGVLILVFYDFALNRKWKSTTTSTTKTKSTSLSIHQ